MSLVLGLLAHPIIAQPEDRPDPAFIAQLPEGMEAPGEPTPDEDNYAHEDDETLETDLTEQEVRSVNSWTAIAEPFGIAVAPLATSGLTLGYTISPDLLTELNYVWGGDKVKDVDYRVELTTLRLKYFVYHSTYVNLGLGHRNVRGTFTADDKFNLLDSEEVELISSVSTLVADIAIGNKWQMDHFVIGCDWLGVSLPIKHISERGFDAQSEQSSGTSFSTYNRISRASTKQFLRIYFGTNF